MTTMLKAKDRASSKRRNERIGWAYAVPRRQFRLNRQHPRGVFPRKPHRSTIGVYVAIKLISPLMAASRPKPANVMQGGSPLSNALLRHTYRSTYGPLPV
jgi:hypothetical protein